MFLLENAVALILTPSTLQRHQPTNHLRFPVTPTDTTRALSTARCSNSRVYSADSYFLDLPDSLGEGNTVVLALSP